MATTNRMPELVEAARMVGCEFQRMDEYYSAGDFRETGDQLVADLVECWSEQAAEQAAENASRRQ